MKLTHTQLLNYYKRKGIIKKEIMKTIGNEETIYGATSINRQIKPYLRRKTEDVDVYSKNPKKDAREAEKHLDKRFGGDFFSTKAAEYKDTTKVKSNVTGRTVADFTKQTKQIPRKRIGKHYYTKLSHIQKSIKKTLKDPTAQYRHVNDREALQRIQLHNKLIKKKPVKSVKRKMKKTKRSYW
jgi:hypothetical protein